MKTRKIHNQLLYKYRIQDHSYYEDVEVSINKLIWDIKRNKNIQFTSYSGVLNFKNCLIFFIWLNKTEVFKMQVDIPYKFHKFTDSCQDEYENLQYTYYNQSGYSYIYNERKAKGN